MSPEKQKDKKLTEVINFLGKTHEASKPDLKQLLEDSVLTKQLVRTLIINQVAHHKQSIESAINRHTLSFEEGSQLYANIVSTYLVIAEKFEIEF